ncbi:reverse transcriptase domain-containing protein [Tanacetum coccineum]
MKHGNVFLKGLLRSCPHHGFSELHNLDTFYKFCDYKRFKMPLDSAVGGNFLGQAASRRFSGLLKASQKVVIQSRANDSRVSTDAPLSNSSPSNNSFDMQQIATSLEDKMTIKMNQMMNQMKALVVTTPAPVKAVEEANDAVLKNVQNQGQNLQNQMANVTSLLTSLCDNFKNSASTSNSGTLPSQTVTNPRQQINAITTRSGDVNGKKRHQNPNLENTAQVPSPGEEDSIFIEIPKPKAKETVSLDPNPNSYPSKLPYPERMKVREHDKPSAQHSRFLKMFKQLRLEIGLKDALVEMPKFNKWLSSLLRNKEKLEEIAITTVNAECSAIIMNKVPEKLEDPGKFLIPCALQELNRTSALADSGASINLLPHSIYKKLELEALTPTRIDTEQGACQSFAISPDGHRTRDVVLESMVSLFLRILCGSTTTHSDDPSPSSSPVKTSDNVEKFADKLALLDSLPPEEGYFDSEGDIAFLDNLLSDDDSHNLASKVTSDHEPEQNESSITFSPRSDPLHHEFAGEPLTLPARNDREFEDYLNLMTVLYEISTSQGNVHQNSVIESLPISPIPVEDSEPTQEEIDILLIPDDLIPPNVEDADSEDEVNESPNHDHHDNPSIPRPPPEPPDIKKCFKPEAGILIIKEFKGISKSHDFMTGILPTLTTLVSDLIFISSFISFENEDTIFDPGIST